MIKLLILGAAGAMGRLISRLALKDDEIDVVAAVDVIQVGAKLGNLVGTGDPKDIRIRDANDLQLVIQETKPEVAVDFTIAQAAEKNCITCVENGLRCVIGTTMLSDEFLNKFDELVKEKQAPAVISSNMATGVNILFKMASILASHLSEWDIEIIEAHHHRKKDNYSGTSLKILSVLCDTLGVNLEEVTKFGRTKGEGMRKNGAKNEIGIHCIRAGDIVGEHTILFAGPGEYIELKHTAIDRGCFANGVIKAAKFLSKTKENIIFSMKDVLNL